MTRGDGSVSREQTRFVLLFIFWTAVLPLFPVEAADRCLSRSEARALWPREHLYWYAGSGQRCWSNSRRSAKSPFPSRPAPLAPAPPAPQAQPWYILPAELTLGPYYAPPEHVFAWDRLTTAGMREHALPEPPEPPGTVIYSSFAPGREPDVWPALGVEVPWYYGTPGGILAALLAVVLGTIGALTTGIRMTN